MELIETFDMTRYSSQMVVGQTQNPNWTDAGCREEDVTNVTRSRIIQLIVITVTVEVDVAGFFKILGAMTRRVIGCCCKDDVSIDHQQRRR